LWSDSDTGRLAIDLDLAMGAWYAKVELDD
jgi:hypothetical protein